MARPKWCTSGQGLRHTPSFYVNNKTSYGVALVVVLVVVLVGSEGSHVHLLGMKLCWLLVAGKCTRDQFPGLPVH